MNLTKRISIIIVTTYEHVTHTMMVYYYQTVFGMIKALTQGIHISVNIVDHPRDQAKDHDQQLHNPWYHWDKGTVTRDTSEVGTVKELKVLKHATHCVYLKAIVTMPPSTKEVRVADTTKKLAI
jgi:hypothetical protein